MPPAASPSPAPSSRPASSSSSPATAAHLGPAADVRVCRKLERQGSFSTPAQANRYVRFLTAQAAAPGASGMLSGRIERTAADLEAYVSGIGSAAQVRRDAVALQAACTGYGVRG